jgi:hypothetical protein
VHEKYMKDEKLYFLVYKLYIIPLKGSQSELTRDLAAHRHLSI